MCWFNPKYLNKLYYLVAFMLLVNSIGCKPNTVSNNAGLKYFDVKGYFTSEATRLTKKRQMILKSIIYNKSTESKKVFIEDWNREFNFFIASDINKPSWKDSYSIEKTDNLLIYRAKFNDLKLKEMIIKQVDKKIKWVLIFNKTDNLLYHSTEKLSYFPDSLYLIEKQQKVKLLRKNTYTVKGFF